jgi:hypothetical protein
VFTLPLAPVTLRVIERVRRHAVIHTEIDRTLAALEMTLVIEEPSLTPRLATPEDIYGMFSACSHIIVTRHVADFFARRGSGAFLRVIPENMHFLWAYGEGGNTALVNALAVYRAPIALPFTC